MFLVCSITTGHAEHEIATACACHTAPRLKSGGVADHHPADLTSQNLKRHAYARVPRLSRANTSMKCQRAKLRSNQPARAATSEGSPWPRASGSFPPRTPAKYTVPLTVRIKLDLHARTWNRAGSGSSWMSDATAISFSRPPAEDSIKRASALVSRSIQRRVSPSPSSGAIMLGQIPSGSLPRISRLRLMTRGFFAYRGFPQTSQKNYLRRSVGSDSQSYAV